MTHAELGRLSVPPGWPCDRFWGRDVRHERRIDGADPQGRATTSSTRCTGRPASTDVVQATVVAESAAVAESLAKSAVIRGSHDGMGLLERAGAWAAVLLLEDGDLMTTPGESGWLA